MSASPSKIVYNLYKKDKPLKVRLLKNEALVQTSESDVRHLIIDLEGSNYVYIPGQSAGVVAPGQQVSGKAHNVRLYSVASTLTAPEAGYEKQKTLTLCVKRVQETHWEKPGETFSGVCSNHLCDLKAGDELALTGPAGKHFILPEAPETRNYVFFATGTGIAPFRAMLRELLLNEKPNTKSEFWLLFGVRSQKTLLYDDEFKSLAQQFSNFKYHVALSRETQNPDGSRRYVQHLIREQAAGLWTRLMDANTSVYVCGTKGMETGIADMIRELAPDQGLSADEAVAKFSSEERYFEEVY